MSKKANRKAKRYIFIQSIIYILKINFTNFHGFIYYNYNFLPMLIRKKAFLTPFFFCTFIDFNKLPFIGRPSVGVYVKCASCIKDFIVSYYFILGK